jgi:hypothetical protein
MAVSVNRTFEAQHYRASGLNLVAATIILWNTVYLELAIGALRQQGRQIDDGLLKHVAPVHWNHINLTGDYSWWQNKRVEKGDSGYSERHPRLSVLYFPFRQTTPSCKGGARTGNRLVPGVRKRHNRMKGPKFTVAAFCMRNKARQL